VKTQFLYGFHPVRAALDAHPERILEAWVDPTRTDSRMAELGRRLQEAGIPVHPASARALERKAGTPQHQGVVVRYRPPPPAGLNDLDGLAGESDGAPALFLALDGVTDPHNLGACMRSAHAAGARAVIVPRPRSAPLTPAARKVASGAAERLPLVVVPNLTQALERLKGGGLWVWGLAAEGAMRLYEAPLTRPCVLVLGAEGRGLRSGVRKRCDGLLRIPMAAGAESLNVSVAAGVALFEAVRQRSMVAARPG